MVCKAETAFVCKYKFQHKTVSKCCFHLSLWRSTLFCVTNRLHLTSVHFTFLQGSALFPGPVKVQSNSHFFLRSFPIPWPSEPALTLEFLAHFLGNPSCMKSGLGLAHSLRLWGSHPASASFLTCDNGKAQASHFTQCSQWGVHTMLPEGLCKWERGPGHHFNPTHVIHACLSQVSPYLNAMNMVAYKQIYFPTLWR